MYNILVTGANGQLGSEIRELEESHPQHYFFFTDSDMLDITDKGAIDLFIQKNSITAIINCAAYTAVDKAESEPKLVDKINHLAVQYLADAAKVYCCKFIHISTDYVFDGTNYKPYKETDKPNPESVYGSTKLAGEMALQKINPKNAVIIRTSWVYSRFGNSFVKTMLRLGKEREELGVIYDQIGTPTYAGDLAKAILTILPKLENSNVELFHYSNEGVCSWYDFAMAIFELEGLIIKIDPIETWQYLMPAKRPSYAVLNKTFIKKTYQLEIPYWKESLKKYFKAVKSLPKS